MARRAAGARPARGAGGGDGRRGAGRSLRPRRAHRARRAAGRGAPRQGGRRLPAERHDGPADRAPDLERPAWNPHRRVPPDMPSRAPRGARVRAPARPPRADRRRPARADPAGGPRGDPRADRRAPARAPAARDGRAPPGVGRPRRPGRVGAGARDRRASRRRAPLGGGAVLRAIARGGRGPLRQRLRLVLQGARGDGRGGARGRRRPRGRGAHLAAPAGRQPRDHAPVRRLGRVGARRAPRPSARVPRARAGARSPARDARRPRGGARPAADGRLPSAAPRRA